MKKPRSNNKNPRAGTQFENRVHDHFLSKHKIKLEKQVAFDLGVRKVKKAHRFDLVSKKNRIIVECKSYTWTTGGNFPSAKFGFLNELMFYFSLAPSGYRKILFMRKHKRKNVSLAHHYIKTNSHLISQGVEVWEMAGQNATRVF
jgi:hypothetical protein